MHRTRSLSEYCEGSCGGETEASAADDDEEEDDEEEEGNQEIMLRTLRWCRIDFGAIENDVLCSKFFRRVFSPL